MRICTGLGHISIPGASCTALQPVVVRGRRQQGLSTHKAQQGRKKPGRKLEIRKSLLAAQLQNNIQVILVVRSECLAVLKQRSRARGNSVGTNSFWKGIPNIKTRDMHLNDKYNMPQATAPLLQFIDEYGDSSSTSVLSYIHILKWFQMFFTNKKHWSQDVHPHACCLPRSDLHGRLPQGKHCQDKQGPDKFLSARRGKYETSRTAHSQGQLNRLSSFDLTLMVAA